MNAPEFTFDPKLTLADLLEMPVHPMADKFPMMPADELQALADDIKANGLRHPIIVGDIPCEDEGGEPAGPVLGIIDGRNRLAACEIAEIENPPVDYFEGDDEAATALILSENVERRSLSAGQRAMARAMLTKDVKQGSRTDLSEDNLAKLGDVAASTVRMARFVLRLDPALAESVLHGPVTLNAAYEAAKAEANKFDEAAQQEQERRTKMDALRREKPKLARQVEDDDLSLDAAWAAYQEELQKKREACRRHTERLSGVMTVLQAPDVMSPAQWAGQLFQHLDSEFFTAGPNCAMDRASIRRAAEMLKALADLFPKKGSKP